MTTKHNLFNDPAKIEAERTLFETSPALSDFNLIRSARYSCEPWAQYESRATGYCWAGWLAAKAQAQEEIEELRKELREALIALTDP